MKQELSDVIIEGNEERFQFTWPEKKKTRLLANASIKATLRPCIDKSVDFESTQNLYIEGDNLDVIKLIRETYLGKIKVIYIDPPYNTGNDFIYEDNFTRSIDEYNGISGDYDNQGNRLSMNSDNNGRFHTDWLNMIYPRLKLSKDLLSDDGVIFISIGHGELANLITVCNEIFNEGNSVGIISRVMKSGGNKGQFFSPNMEHILVYAKNKQHLGPFREPLSQETMKTYNHVESGGSRIGEKFTIKGICQPGLGIRVNQRYWIEAPDGSFLIPRGKNFPSLVKEGEAIVPTDEDTCWRWTYQRYKQEKELGNVYFSKSSTATALVDQNGETAKWNVFSKIWLSDREEEGRVPVDLISKWENRTSSDELKKLDIPFDFAKPSELIKYLIGLVENTSDSTIMDFFSGSATTAHAVMQLNAEDGGHRRFIMVQLPEVCGEDSEAYKAGYKTICEIGEERIRRAGNKIKEEAGLLAQNLDTGFRVLKLDSSNMKDVYYNPDQTSQQSIEDMLSNVKEDRTPMDLLFQVMLEIPALPSSKIVEKSIEGKKVLIVNDNDLICCFDDDIGDDVVKAIAQMKPLYAVFRDSSFKSDDTMVNAEQYFRTYSPDTQYRII